MAAFALTGGDSSRLTPLMPAAATTDLPAARPRVTLDKDGYPVLPPGMSMMFINGKGRWHSAAGTMSDLADMLSVQLNMPVTDETGLSGKYDLTLAWASGAEGPTIFVALEDQLGFKLEQKRGWVDVLVVDKVEKPAIN
jgi:uncharacterized protein (TIGR03435 family)